MLALDPAASTYSFHANQLADHYVPQTLRLARAGALRLTFLLTLLVIGRAGTYLSPVWVEDRP
jgi:hypothetical protein